MPDRTRCARCGKIGFVRREHVIKGGNAVTAFYCGACNRSWDVAEEEQRDSEQQRHSPDR